MHQGAFLFIFYSVKNQMRELFFETLNNIF